MSAKLTSSGLFKRHLYEKQVCDVMASVHDVTNNFLLRDSNYIVGIWSCDHCLVTLAFQ